MLALLVGAEEDDNFQSALRAFEALAVDALRRGLTRAESVAELRETELGRTELFNDVYPVVFQRTALARRRDEI